MCLLRNKIFAGVMWQIYYLSHFHSGHGDKFHLIFLLSIFRSWFLYLREKTFVMVWFPHCYYIYYGIKYLVYFFHAVFVLYDTGHFCPLIQYFITFLSFFFVPIFFNTYLFHESSFLVSSFVDLFCGLFVAVPGYKPRECGFDSRRYQIL